MNPKYTPLFQPYTLNNGTVIKNRLTVTPMTYWAKLLLETKSPVDYLLLLKNLCSLSR